MLKQLDTENADVDLTGYITVLTDTPDTANPVECQALVLLGDGVKDLDGTGGTFKIKVEIGSQESHELSFTVTAADVRAVLWTPKFPVPANTVVIIKVLSPNGADTDVDATAYLYDLDPLAITPTEPTTVETTLRGMLQQTWRRLFKKSTQTATELKTYKDDGTSVVTTQTVSDDETTQTMGAAS